MSEYLDVREILNERAIGAILVGVGSFIALAGPRLAEIGMHNKISQTSKNRYLIHSARATSFIGLGMFVVNRGLDLLVK